MEKIYDKYVIDAEATIPNKMTPPAPALGGNPANDHFGQVKYAKREGAPSIYKDVTRNTANDNLASAKAEGSASCDINIDQSEHTDMDQD
jgi:hypothetical protein